MVELDPPRELVLEPIVPNIQKSKLMLVVEECAIRSDGT